MLEVIVPAELQGDVMGDLNSRRARVQGTEVADVGEQMIVALVPTAELRRYAVDLRSRTSGRGRFQRAPRPLRRPARPPGRLGGRVRQANGRGHAAASAGAAARAGTPA